MKIVPVDWRRGSDFPDLGKIPGSDLTENFKSCADDLVWWVKVTGAEWVNPYLLIEFRSTVDRAMAVRILFYVGLHYQDLIKRRDVLRVGHFSPLLPIVLYNGVAPVRRRST